jgi:hypothetical protein
VLLHQNAAAAKDFNGNFMPTSRHRRHISMTTPQIQLQRKALFQRFWSNDGLLACEPTLDLRRIITVMKLCQYNLASNDILITVCA